MSASTLEYVTKMLALSDEVNDICGAVVISTCMSGQCLASEREGGEEHAQLRLERRRMYEVFDGLLKAANIALPAVPRRLQLRPPPPAAEHQQPY